MERDSDSLEKEYEHFELSYYTGEALLLTIG